MHFLKIHIISLINLNNLWYLVHFFHQEATRPRGIRDDTTCIVIDILPPENIVPSPRKRPRRITFNNVFRKRHLDVPPETNRSEYAEPDVVEEIFEDGSPMLSKRWHITSLTIICFTFFTCIIVWLHHTHICVAIKVTTLRKNVVELSLFLKGWISRNINLKSLEC
jgi:hypothetical protein